MEKDSPHPTLSHRVDTSRLPPGQFKTSFPDSHYYNSHLGKTPPPLHTHPHPERLKQESHYEEIPDQHRGFGEDEYDYIPDVCHNKVRKNKSCDLQPPIPPKRKNFLESDAALRRKSCPQAVIVTTTQDVYYNLENPLSMGTQRPKSVLEDPHSYNTKNKPPTPERKMEDNDYYNLKDPPQSIPPKPPLPQNSYSGHADYEDTDDCDYVNAWIPSSEEARQSADLNLRQPSPDPVKNKHPSHQDSAQDLPHSYRNILILTSPSPESEPENIHTSSLQLSPRVVSKSFSAVPIPSSKSISYSSHQESAQDLPHSYRNIPILTSPSLESETENIATSSPRLPPRGVTHSSSAVPVPLKKLPKLPESETANTLASFSRLPPRGVIPSSSAVPVPLKKPPKLPESETANALASFSRLPPRGVTPSSSAVPVPLKKPSKSQKPPPPPKPLKLTTLSKSKPTNKWVKRDSRLSSSSSQSEPATPTDLTEEKRQEKIARLEEENARLKEENARLKEDNARLEEEKEQFWHRYSDIYEQLSDAEKQIEKKTSEVILLQQRLSEIQHSQPGTGPQTVEFWKVSRKDIQVQEHRILGRGGWGYVAEGKFRSQKVAVKRVYKEILQPYTMERIHREIDTMAQVRHPNLLLFIAAVLDDEGGPMIITEILDTSLRKAYEDRHLGSKNITRTRIFRDIASALNYLHQHREPIIHRDVSSANVLLEALANNVWKAKLSDFGSANLVRLATTPGEGAFVYTAPEGFPHPHTSHPPPQTPKIDVYSYGILLCEVITQKFPDPDSFSNMLRQVRRKWLSMHALITHCTKTKPEDRPTMTDILEQLDKMPEFSYNY